MHNYFVSFVYDCMSGHRFGNCIMVDMTDTATSTASQLDALIKRFTQQIEQELGEDISVTIVNLNKMN